MNLKKITYLAFCLTALTVIFAGPVSAQKRDRVVSTVSSQPINQPPVSQQDRTKPLTSSRPTNRPALENNIVVVGQQPLIKRTASDKPIISSATTPVNRTFLYSRSTSDLIMSGIQARYGIPYLYGSTGPNRYDCSGFVWSVFRDAGIYFERQSARSLWSMTEPVEGADRFKFGTLVFLNGLGHMGIVADENGFYHASSSKGITYSPFKGYWSNRIVGFRRMPAGGLQQ